MNTFRKLLTFKDAPSRNIASVTYLMQRVFANFEGHLQVQLWDGKCIHLGQHLAPHQGSPFTLIFRTPAILINFIKHGDPLSFAESYFRGEMDIEGDLDALLSLRDQFNKLEINWRIKFFGLINWIKIQYEQGSSLPHWRCSHINESPLVLEHTRAENMDSIKFHYDVSNSFYKLWLDTSMIYSCAYFSNVCQDLNSAQLGKLDLICRKLQLESGDQFLDIGCGWGALVIFAAQNYGVIAHGITLSKKQYDYAQDQIKKEGLGNCVTVKLCDYRDIPGHAVFNKIASVGMVEHVGIKNLPVYFKTVNRLLTDRGLFLNHGITSDIEGWPNNLGHTFVNRYVFPDGQLETISNILRQMELAEFEIMDLESMRAHYALTLKHWVTQLSQQHDQALQYVNEATFRIWLTYMTASRLSFESGSLGLYQVLICKRAIQSMHLPLTRHYMLDRGSPV